MVKLILKINDEYFEINDIVTIKNKNSTILTGRIMEFSFDNKDGFWLDKSEKYSYAREWVYIKDIYSIVKVK